MKKLYFFSIITFFSYNVKAQVGIGTTTPQAALDVTSTTGGFLPPRIALTSTTSASPITSPVAGTLIYNTVTAGTSPNNVTPGYYFWNGSIWKMLSDNWSINGSKGTVAGALPNASTLSATGVNFIGTTDAVDFVARTNNVERLRITSNGVVDLMYTHLKSVGDSPVISINPDTAKLLVLGVGPVTTSITGTNTRGTITVNIPISVATTFTVKVTFAATDTSYSVPPTVIITPAHSSASNVAYYVDNAATTTTSFTMVFTSLASIASTPMFNYMIIE